MSTVIGYTVEETRQKLRCSERQVWRLLADGTLSRVEGAPGKETLVSPASLDAYVRSLTAEPAPRPKPRPRAERKKTIEERRAELEAKRARLGLAKRAG